MLISLIASVCILVLSGLFLLLVTRDGFSARETRWIRNGWVINLLGMGGFLLIIFFVYGSGDMFVYHRHGVVLADLLRSDIGYYLPHTIDVFLQRPTPIDPFLYSAESSTGSMTAMTGWLMLFVGDSLVAACVLVAMLAFSGRLAIFLAFREDFGQPNHRFMLAIGSFGVPSAIFWTGGLLKETMACFGLGWALWGAINLVRKRYIFRSIFAILGPGLVLLMIKPYIVVPLGIGVGAYFIVRRARHTGRSLLGLLHPAYLLVGAVLGIGSILLVGEFFPRFALGSIAEEAARLQSFSQSGAGASSYQLGDAQAKTLGQQLQFMPVALLTSLFRPLIFEIHNAPAALSGLEMLMIQFTFLTSLWRKGPNALLARCVNSPPMAFCIVFVVLLALGVGLATTNLGTLTRYRAPLMPFYVMLLLFWGVPAGKPQAATKPRPVPPVRRTRRRVTPS